MTVLSDAMADLAGDVDVGSSAVYSSPGRDDVTVSVNYEVEISPEPDGYNGVAWAELQTIEALLSGIGQTPKVGDTFTIDTTAYEVYRVIEKDAVWVKVAVK